MSDGINLSESKKSMRKAEYGKGFDIIKMESFSAELQRLNAAIGPGTREYEVYLFLMNQLSSEIRAVIGQFEKIINSYFFFKEIGNRSEMAFERTFFKAHILTLSRICFFLFSY